MIEGILDFRFWIGIYLSHIRHKVLNEIRLFRESTCFGHQSTCLARFLMRNFCNIIFT